MKSRFPTSILALGCNESENQLSSSAAKLAGIVIALALFVSLLISPAHAEPSDGGGEERPVAPSTVRYIQADSQAEADRIFEGMSDEEANPSSPSARAGKVKYGPCTLEVQGVYLRQSFNYNAVGFKSYTRCTTKVTSIHHYMRLQMKDGLYWRSIVPTVGTSNVSRGESALSSKGTAFTCPKKSPKHWWSGSTKAQIVYKGETYYATGNAPVSQAKIACHA